MKKKRLLDSYAMIAYLKKEDNYQKVLEILTLSTKYFAIMNEINVGESYYIIGRERSYEHADYFIETILPNLPVQVVSNSFGHIIEASRIKTNHSLSYADCFAVATAIREKATIVTGDPEFKKVKNLVEIEWL